MCPQSVSVRTCNDEKKKIAFKLQRKRTKEKKNSSDVGKFE